MVKVTRLTLNGLRDLWVGITSARSREGGCSSRVKHDFCQSHFGRANTSKLFHCTVQFNREKGGQRDRHNETSVCHRNCVASVFAPYSGPRRSQRQPRRGSQDRQGSLHLRLPVGG